jgi:hypothetical protein
VPVEEVLQIPEHNACIPLLRDNHGRQEAYCRERIFHAHKLMEYAIHLVKKQKNFFFIRGGLLKKKLLFRKKKILKLEEK